MNIFVYSDESGVLDKKHNKYFVFGGVIFLSKEDKDTFSRKYTAVENIVRESECIFCSEEVKACNITAKSKYKLYKLIRHEERFGVVVNQKDLEDKLFESKKSKQRYLDWVFKMSVKEKLKEMISRGLIEPNKVDSVYFFCDEHTTATSGLYELRESLEKELTIGMWNYETMVYHNPLFPFANTVTLQYFNSKKSTLIRVADIVANHIFYIANKYGGRILPEDKLHMYYHPYCKKNYRH